MKNEILKAVGKVVISAAVGYVTTKVMEKVFDKANEISGKRFDKKWKKKMEKKGWTIIEIEDFYEVAMEEA